MSSSVGKNTKPSTSRQRTYKSSKLRPKNRTSAWANLKTPIKTSKSVSASTTRKSKSVSASTTRKSKSPSPPKTREAIERRISLHLAKQLVKKDLADPEKREKALAMRMKTENRPKEFLAAQSRLGPRINDPKRIPELLNAICPNSGECVAFGLQVGPMRAYFDNYNLSLVAKNAVKRIGGNSNNGFVLEVPFVKDNYTAYTVLKSTQDANSDNLFYEALVGIYINKKNYIFPCFLETYGLYQWPYIAARMGARKGETQQLGLLERKNMSYNAFFDKPEFISDTCLEAELGCVLIQHIHGARTLLNHIRSLKSNMLFFTYHLVQYLYQIYAPLGVLSDEFTHYDLKTDNVLLYTLGKDRDADYHNTAIKAEGVPHNGEYITMNYHYPNRKVVSFNTFDIVKIIDYGRCYFKESEKYNSHNYLKVLRESIIKVAKSDKDLKATHPRRRGECTNRSYVILEDEDPEGSFHYICSNKRNKTHDLRLANEIWTTPEKYNSTNQDENGLRSILNAIFYEDTYQVERGKRDHGYGSEEVLESSYTELETLRKSNPKATMKLEPGKSIRNVEDMHLALKDLILHTSHFKEMSELFESHKKIGEMDIWLDGSKSLVYTAATKTA